ncbi:Pumilio RNA-binding repeat [Sesbania bispinosa]|nr:Pumilio RNA-binding repeat [Sesbania bispinosa]
MAHEDFTLSMNNNHPYPFMLDPPSQYGPSEGHDFHVSAIENPMAMETPNFYAPRNLNHYQSSENIATRMEGLDSAMARLNLSDNRFRNTANVELYSNPLDSVTNNLIMDASSYEKNLHEMRIRASVVEGAERRMHSLCLSPISTRDMAKTDYINHRQHSSNYLHDFELRREQVVSIAKDYDGSRVLQFTFDFGTLKEIEFIISNVMNHLHDLMIHPYGNFLIQKIFQASRVTMVQKNIILFLIIMDEHKLIDVCMDNHGTRVVQKILENINTQQISEVIDVMKSITVVLMKNFNGGYVIQQCVKLFPPAYKKVMHSTSQSYALFDYIMYDIAISYNYSYIVKT